VSDEVTDTETGDADRQRVEPGLFFDGDDVSVAIESQRPKPARAQYRNGAAPPRVVRPPTRFGEEVLIGRWAEAAQA
jgi:hypothetical protein